MMMKIKDSLWIACGMLLFAMPSADAATILTYGGQTVEARANYTGLVGSMVQVNTTGLSVTQLGVMDVTAGGGNQSAGSDGFTATANPISVGIWSWNGTTATLLAQAAVNDNDTLFGGYRYVDIAPVALTSGQQYIIAAVVGGGIEWFLDGFLTSTTIASSSSSDFTLLGNTAGGSNLNTPGFSVPGGPLIGRWAPANATVVPEPAAALLGGLGVLALLRRRRR